MTTATFILKNALRNKRRAGLSILSVAVSLFLFVTLRVALRELTVPPEDAGAALRVVVRNKVSIASPLPARQRGVIERIAGVEAVSPFTWFGGKYGKEDNMTFAQFAIDPTRLRPLFGEARIATAETEAFEKDQTACILGKITADKYHLKPGDRMVLASIIYPCSVELKIAGVYSGTIDDRNLFFHHKYLEESCGTAGEVGTWWVKVRAAEDMTRVLETINGAFANTSAEVRAESERAFQLSFISMWGNISLLVSAICSVVVATLLLVTASTMSMAIRERFRELAVLKALGFQRRELFGFILAESFGLALAGAFVGVGGAWLFYTHMKIASVVLGVGGAGLLLSAVRQVWGRRFLGGALAFLAGGAMLAFATKIHAVGGIAKMTDNMLLKFEVTPGIMGFALAIAASLGILASIFPSRAVARMSVVNGLKTLD